MFVNIKISVFIITSIYVELCFRDVQGETFHILKDGAYFCLLCIRSAHLVILGFSYGWCLLIQGYFARFKTMRRKQNLSSARGIQKENWG